MRENPKYLERGSNDKTWWKNTQWYLGNLIYVIFLVTLALEFIVYIMEEVFINFTLILILWEDMKVVIIKYFDLEQLFSMQGNRTEVTTKLNFKI